ncbi:unnamed protein product [Trichogramma brassicae]|uniref:Uncharacterized protein n=1 Tax=Trichogramma brassicae TaxID=86971 RepID=A0A6H5IBT8_9HYME|nr:unnamed protein product [Trichogramma brassicae]
MKIRISGANQDRWNTHYFQFRPWFCLSKITLNVFLAGFKSLNTPGVTFKGLNSSVEFETRGGGSGLQLGASSSPLLGSDQIKSVRVSYRRESASPSSTNHRLTRQLVNFAPTPVDSGTPETTHPPARTTTASARSTPTPPAAEPNDAAEESDSFATMLDVFIVWRLGAAARKVSRAIADVRRTTIALPRQASECTPAVTEADEVSDGSACLAVHGRPEMT